MSHSINWFPWCQDTFTKACNENKPILMYLTARWCGWCVIMEDTTYQDPQVIDAVEENFVPIKVNVDQYPHVADRYHFGGFPSVVFLSVDGQILKGENYLPGEQMKAVLKEVLLRDRHHKRSFTLRYEENLNRKNISLSKMTEKTSLTIGDINKIITSSYDREFGGFIINTPEIKFPFPEIHDYLLRFVQDNPGSQEELILKRTLDILLAGEIYDHQRGGFYRFCEARDWTLARSEKLLDSNAALTQNFLRAFQIFGREQYGRAAKESIDYLISDFFDRDADAFVGSRIGKETDTTPYTNWNSMAVSSLLKAYSVLGDKNYLKIALKVIEFLWTKCYRLGRGMSHFYANGPSQVELLSDQIKFIFALYDAYLYTEEKIYLHRANLLWRYMEKNYRLPDGCYSDIPLNEQKWGYLNIQLAPFMENVDAALLFIKFARLFGEGVYAERADEILKGLRGMINNNPIFAAKYGQGLLEMENYRVKNQNLC